MKIGIDARSLEGKRTGVGRYLINLLDEWQKTKNKNIKFVLYFKEEIPKDLKFKKSDSFKLKLLKKPIEVSSNVLFIHFSLPKEAKKDKVDILFCPEYIAPLFCKIPTALTLHDIIYEVHPEMYNWPSRADKFLLKTVSRISAKKAKQIFTPSEFTKKEVVKHYKVKPDKVKATYLAADNSFKRVYDKKKLDNIKRKYQIEDKFVLYAGSIFNRRHLDKTIKAFQKIAKDFPNYQFLIVGSNHTSPYVDIDSLVEITNHRLNRQAILRRDYLKDEDLLYLYNAAEALIWLSDYEGFGLPVLEAMACATPVIISSKTSLPEVANEAAIYIEDNQNTKEISKAIYIGITNQSLRSRLVKKGIERADYFSWEKCAKETLDALKDFKNKV